MKKVLFSMLAVAIMFVGVHMAWGETVEIVAEDDWYPYCAKIGEGVEGISVDLIKAAFNAEGVDVVFVPMNFDRGMAAVKDGKAIGCFNAVRTAESENTYLWHDEKLFSADSVFYAHSDFSGQVTSPKDIEGKKIGLTQGYGYGDAIEQNQKITKEYSKSDEIILKKCAAKRVDFVILYDKVAEYLIGKLGIQGQVKPVGSSESTDIYLAFSKANPAGSKFRDIFSSGMKKIKGDGTYKNILDSWDAKLKGGN